MTHSQWLLRRIVGQKGSEGRNTLSEQRLSQMNVSGDQDIASSVAEEDLVGDWPPIPF